MARRANNFNSNSVNSPITGADAVTPSDTVPLSGGACRALYIGVTGDVAVILADDTAAVTFKAAPVGLLPVQCSKVMSTNTTATNILALY